MNYVNKQELADKFASETLTAMYGERFTLLEDIEDDEEINAKWEFLNERFYEIIKSIY